MKKFIKKEKLLNFFDKALESQYFLNVYYPNLTNFTKPPLNYETKYSTQLNKGDLE
jgi:hypothetical protein